MNEIVKLEMPELQGIEKSKASKIKATFVPMTEMLFSFENAYDGIISESKKGITKELSVKAKNLRLNIGKVRIETGKIKDKQKEYIKLEDRAIMGVHNIIVWAVKEKEDKLKEIEKDAEIQEKKRREALQHERAEKLSLYIEDAHERDLCKFEPDEFEALLSIKKKAFEDEIKAKEKATKDQIAKEKAEAYERKRIREENEKLKSEAEEAEGVRIKAEKERKRLAEIEANKLEAERKERDRIRLEELAKARAILDKLEAEKQRLIAIEKAKADKLQEELKAKKDAEIKVEKERLDQIELKANQGDNANVNDLISDFRKLKDAYTFKSNKNKKMYNNVSVLIDKVIDYINKD